jgi:hypothetical protein
MSSRFTGFLEEGRISSSQGSSHQGCPGTGNTGPAMFRLGLKASSLFFKIIVPLVSLCSTCQREKV